MRYFDSSIAALLVPGVVCALYGQMLSPRFYLGSPLLGRDDVCLASSHSCLDVNATGSCCLNTEYCQVDANFLPKCCQIGSDCGNPCSSASYVCPTTITTSGTTTVSAACCGRSCGISSFKCAASFGGGCCGYGFMCTTSGQCVSTQTTTSAPVVTAIPSGCSAANQFSCAANQGGGCCDNGYVCTVLENTNYCAFATGTAVKTRTGTGGILATSVPADSSSSSLSTGAKAGIGVGVSLVALAIIGALMWFCLVHRRTSRQHSQESESAPAVSQQNGSEVRNGSKTGSKTGSKRPSAGRQPSQPSDYFGPAAGVGPFTEEHTSTDVSPGYDRGVPAIPHGPDDIASPVEIDTTEHSTIPSPGGVEPPKFSIENAFELP